MERRRNEPCHCGSGTRYKWCHGKIGEAAATLPSDNDMQRALAQLEAEQMIREQQQGLGRPIVAAKLNDHQVVAVKNKIYYSKEWKTVPDFLSGYLKNVLDPAWGNAELAKPLADRHTILQWYEEYCTYQRKTIKTPGVVRSAEVTGVVACYLGLAYSLYLIDHNVELQERLVRRLKKADQFQGAYYELMIANALIRAGFELTLEDETDGATKHCEFFAVSKKSGKKYWIEAKSRAVAGLLGKTTVDGGSDKNPLSQLIPHLNAALAKPASDERLIFIELNAPMSADAHDGKRPEFIERATKRLEDYQTKELTTDKSAYVFITNTAFHRHLEGQPAFVVVPFGLGIPDFNRTGYFRLSERYRQEQKHSDAIAICDAFASFLKFPVTFDGSLPSETYNASSSRVIIGQTYFFDSIGDNGTLGTVTTATVNIPEKAAYIAIFTPDKQSLILKQPMSDSEIEDYKQYGDAYFGRPEPPRKEIKTSLDMFQWVVKSSRGMSRKGMLEWFGKRPDIDRLAAMNDDDLYMEYCEAVVISMEAMKGARPKEK